MDFWQSQELSDDYGWAELAELWARPHVFREKPDVVYRVPGGRINGYDYSPTLDELLHDFRPTGDFLFELEPEEGEAAYMVGDAATVERLEREFSEVLGEPGYGKILRKPS